MGSTELVAHFFVYGTLKRGHARERYWPVKPLAVEIGWTLGRLYDLGPYPGLLAGRERVLGELWRFRPEEIQETLQVLDEVEGFRNEPGDWYCRVVIECTTVAGSIVSAFTYQYARPLPDGARLIAPGERGFCVWPGSGTTATDDRL